MKANIRFNKESAEYEIFLWDEDDNECLGHLTVKEITFREA
jgi:hypothetical protein